MSDSASVSTCNSALTALRAAALALDGVQILPYAYGPESIFFKGTLVGHIHRSGVSG